MKALIVAINTKYIHTALAPWYLKSCCPEAAGEVKVLEFTINDLQDEIMARIYKEGADIIAFSCYIWNICLVLSISENLKKLMPDCKIVLGGPEVSFDAEEMMNINQFIDFTLSGEGEATFPKLIEHISCGLPVNQVEGLYYRENSTVKFTCENSALFCLDEIPSPYTEEFFRYAGNRIVYYESSRGCPYSCSYCISSTFSGVRYFSLDRVYQDLKKLTEHGVRQVKFVDRTFNCNRNRMISIFKYIIENPTQTAFHFEMAADLFDDELLELISSVPKGLFQFELGVQSTNEITLNSVNRRTDMSKAIDNIKKLLDFKNMHVHLDLIAGMPFEGIDSFKASFNDVYRLRPHKLQLGFLKLLKGTKIRENASEYGYVYKSAAPYEVLFNKFISYDEILELKAVEEILERFYNSGRFVKSLDYIIHRCFSDAYAFYKDFTEFNIKEGYLYRHLSLRDQYDVFHGYAAIKLDEDKLERFNECMRLDYFSSDNTLNLPASITQVQDREFRDKSFRFLMNAANIKTYLNDYSGQNAKQIIKKVHFEKFAYDINNSELNKKQTVLFDYNVKDPVTGLYKYMIVDEKDLLT